MSFTAANLIEQLFPGEAPILFKQLLQSLRGSRKGFQTKTTQLYWQKKDAD